MKFCPECGTNVEGLKFCPECGNKLTQEEPVKQAGTSLNEENREKVLWEGAQVRLFGLGDKMKYKATDNIELKMKEEKYIITNHTITIREEGSISSKENMVNFLDIKDAKVEQDFKAKLQGIGNVVVTLYDGSSIMLKSVKEPENVKRLIMTNLLNLQRNRNTVFRKDI